MLQFTTCFDVPTRVIDVVIPNSIKYRKFRRFSYEMFSRDLYPRVLKLSTSISWMLIAQINGKTSETTSLPFV